MKRGERRGNLGDDPVRDLRRVIRADEPNPYIRGIEAAVGIHLERRRGNRVERIKIDGKCLAVRDTAEPTASGRNLEREGAGLNKSRDGRQRQLCAGSAQVDIAETAELCRRQGQLRPHGNGVQDRQGDSVCTVCVGKEDWDVLDPVRIDADTAIVIKLESQSRNQVGHVIIQQERVAIHNTARHAAGRRNMQPQRFR